MTSLFQFDARSPSAASFTFAVCKSFNQLFFRARRMSLQPLGIRPFGEMPRQKNQNILEVSLLHGQHIALLPTLGDLADL